MSILAGLLASWLVAAPATAQPIASAPTAQQKADYSLPWGLRPGIAPNLVRSDTSFAMQERARTIASTLTGGYKLFGASAGLYARIAWVHQSPDGKGSAGALSNPLVFGLFTPTIANGLRLPLFFGMTAPIGEGGGSSATPATFSAVGAGTYARSAMDNALFAVNYFTATGGAGLAYVKDGATLQAEVTFLQLLRVRGETVDKDEARTNFTSGVHAGYRILPPLTVSVELRWQQWLSTPAAVSADDAKRGQVTFALGMRLNLPLSRTALVRPGFSYTQPIDDPMAAQRYRVLALDVPFVF